MKEEKQENSVCGQGGTRCNTRSQRERGNVEGRSELKKVDEIEGTSSGELKRAVSGRGWFAQLRCCCLVDLNMGVEFETAE